MQVRCFMIIYSSIAENMPVYLTVFTLPVLSDSIYTPSGITNLGWNLYEKHLHYIHTHIHLEASWEDYFRSSHLLKSCRLVESWHNVPWAEAEPAYLGICYTQDNQGFWSCRPLYNIVCLKAS